MPPCWPTVPSWWPLPWIESPYPKTPRGCPPLCGGGPPRPARRTVTDSDITASTTGLTARLRGLSPEARQRELVDLVCGNAATVLGLPGTAEVNVGHTFQDLGFDSPTAL